jgi:hypothetical protein
MTSLHPTPIRTAVLLAGSALLAASAAACGSTAGGPAAPATTSPAATTSSATTPPLISTGKPGCDDAIAAVQDSTSTLAAKMHDLPSLQTFATDLVTRLHTAAGKATDPTIQSAIGKMADDLSTLATDAHAGDGGQVQTVLSTLVNDGAAMVQACR